LFTGSRTDNGNEASNKPRLKFLEKCSTIEAQIPAIFALTPSFVDKAAHKDLVDDIFQSIWHWILLIDQP